MTSNHSRSKYVRDEAGHLRQAGLKPLVHIIVVNHHLTYKIKNSLKQNEPLLEISILKENVLLLSWTDYPGCKLINISTQFSRESWNRRDEHYFHSSWFSRVVHIFISACWRIDMYTYNPLGYKQSGDQPFKHPRVGGITWDCSTTIMLFQTTVRICAHLLCQGTFAHDCKDLMRTRAFCHMDFITIWIKDHSNDVFFFYYD